MTPIIRTTDVEEYDARINAALDAAAEKWSFTPASGMCGAPMATKDARKQLAAHRAYMDGSPYKSGAY